MARRTLLVARFALSKIGVLAADLLPLESLLASAVLRARGVFVKTLINAVALNNLACIVLFELARAASTFHGGASSSLAELTGPALGLLAASAIGAAIGLGTGHPTSCWRAGHPSVRSG
jgi:hypothetical protein